MGATTKTQAEEDRPSRRRTAWISRGLEALIADPELQPPPGSIVDFDVVIVGSGYGGAVAAAAVAGGVDPTTGAPLRVCVLERGREYLAGSFPSRQAELPRQVRWATSQAWRAGGVATGLFDLRLGTESSALVASGVGGGSLINAGVMERPHDSVFEDGHWPPALRDAAERTKRYQDMRERLGAVVHAATTPKEAALRALGGGKALPITIAATTGANDAGVVLDACIRCGDCATGCNHNAKHSLDLGLLRQAQQLGALVISGATVLRLRRPGTGDDPGSHWLLEVVHTDRRLRERQGGTHVLRAGRVVLAAGTFGSTEILMRSDSLQCSSQLGRRMSTNGDMIATLHDLALPVNAIADERQDPRGGRGIGSTITTMLDGRHGDRRRDIVVQDLAVPGPLRRIFEELVTTADVLNRLNEGDKTVHESGSVRPDPAAIDPGAMARSLPIAIIGRDDAQGRLVWPSETELDGTVADGLLTIEWPGLRDDPRWAEWHARVRTLLENSGKGGRMIDNPMWRPLSDDLERVFGRQRGPLMTVHPLGGCAMGADANSGVTNELGAVFDAASPRLGAVHEGLYVLDGSIVPTSLGINPALTIAVLAQLAAEDWTTGPRAWCRKPGAGAPGLAATPPSARRPIYRVPRVIAQPAPTRIELSEQLRGQMVLSLGERPPQRYWVELTLISAPTELAALMQFEHPERCIEVAAGQGMLRVLSRAPDPLTDRSVPGDTVLQAMVGGRIRLFRDGPTHPFGRALRAGWAWLFNRGINDGVKSFLESLRVALQMQVPPALAPQGLKQRAGQMWRLFTLAGTVRLMEYDLVIEQVQLPSSIGDAAASRLVGAPIRGLKNLAYTRCASPWAQLMEVEPTEFPGWRPGQGKPPQLVLNPRYLARRVVPLLRVVDQEDRVSSLADLASFVLYALRLVLQVHALSFRQPDAPLERQAERLPGLMPGLPPPEYTWLDVEKADVPAPFGPRHRREPRPAQIRLARYRPSPGRSGSSGDVPVIAIHGYSASGTTFAHPEVPQGLVPTLVERGREVWVLDMRSSAGMPTARDGWAFETMGSHDIPAAIAHVRQVTGAPRVDVVAHCMGAVMFSMSLLQAGPPAYGGRNLLHRSIRRLVLSQAGPVLVMSPANILRAYVMRYVREFLPLGDYAFTPEGDRTLLDRLFDRFLATMPVPPEEFRLENPWWPPGLATPWAGSRRRMDALYARTFALANMEPRLLAHFDDHFGPLSVDTVSQVIHFARFATVTDRQGFNRYVVPKRLRNFRFPVFALHGDLNGLTDPSTLQLLRIALAAGKSELLNQYAPDAQGIWPTQTAAEIGAEISKHRQTIDSRRRCLLTWRIPGHGHQDVLIGREAGVHCARIADFLA